MRGMMVAVGGSGIGGVLGCLAGIPLPGFELASALLGTLGAMAGMAAGTLLCVTAPPSWSVTAETVQRGPAWLAKLRT